jgi:hypothetical protein
MQAERQMGERLTELLVEQARIARLQSRLIARQAEMMSELARGVERKGPQPEGGAGMRIVRRASAA